MTHGSPYFCRSQSGEETALHDDMDKAIAEAEERRLAPFTIYRYFAQPVGQRLTNGRKPKEAAVDQG